MIALPENAIAPTVASAMPLPMRLPLTAAAPGAALMRCERRARSRRLGGGGGFGPAAAEHLVQHHLVLRLRKARLQRQRLRREKRTLRVEQVEARGNAVAEAQVDQTVARALGLHREVELACLFAQRVAAGQRV